MRQNKQNFAEVWKLAAHRVDNFLKYLLDLVAVISCDCSTFFILHITRLETWTKGFLSALIYTIVTTCCTVPIVIWQMFYKFLIFSETTVKYGTEYSRVDQTSLLRQTLSLQIFWRLSSTNFTWSILECLDSYEKWVKCSSILWLLVYH